MCSHNKKTLTVSRNLNVCLIASTLLGMCATGCGATLPKMNASAPIEKKSVFLGTEYQQNGQRIDREDMLSKLENEPEPADHLSGHGALSVSAVLLGGSGGALVGWPLGQAAVGNDDPLWVLAGVGAGLIVVAIPLAIVADNKVESAVDAHNLSLHGRLNALFASAPDLQIPRQ